MELNALDETIRPTASIVPAGSIAGRSLMAVVAIMTFLAALTAGAVQLTASAAADWGSEVSREVTIQVRPVEGRDIEAAVTLATTLAQATTGVADVRAYSRAETERMLTPWLGDTADMSDLPIPRLIVVRIGDQATPDLAALKKALADQVPGASLDDHRFWVDRLATMARTIVISGLVVLGLMIAATALSVVFATRGAMAGNRQVIEVLHFVGARDSFIAGEFQHHFLWLGLKGGAIGGAAAVLVFAIAHALASRFVATAGGDQIEALFGSFAVGWMGYAAIIGTVAIVSLLTGLTSRFTVRRALAETM
jgi:cell division transport system permease protein